MLDAGILATVLLLVGLFLLGLEFFVPSFGMILTVAIVSLVVSFWSACKAWWGVSPWFFWTYIVVLVAGIPGSFLGTLAIIPRTSFGSRMILRPRAGANDQTNNNPLSDLVGKCGIAQTMMTPGGIVVIDGERHHAESRGMLIDPQMPVVVLAIKGSRLLVRVARSEDLNRAKQLAAKTDSPAPDVFAEVPPETTSETNPLDFDVPEDYTRNT